MKPVRTFKVMDERWRLKYVKETMYSGDHHIYGDTDWNTKTIRLSAQSQLTDYERLNVAIHEFLHAAMPWAREWFIDKLATTLATFLYRLGCRLDHDQ